MGNVNYEGITYIEYMENNSALNKKVVLNTFLIKASNDNITNNYFITKMSNVTFRGKGKYIISFYMKEVEEQMNQFVINNKAEEKLISAYKFNVK